MCKIQTGGQLTDAEAAACVKLKVVDEPDTSESEEEERTDIKSFLEQSRRKRRKLEAGVGAHSKGNKEHVDVSQLICFTSNACERLFSEAKHIMVPHRRGMSPVLFEVILFLKKNVRFWNVFAVVLARKDDAVNERDNDMCYEQT